MFCYSTTVGDYVVFPNEMRMGTRNIIFQGTQFNVDVLFTSANIGVALAPAESADSISTARMVLGKVEFRSGNALLGVNQIIATGEDEAPLISEASGFAGATAYQNGARVGMVSVSGRAVVGFSFLDKLVGKPEKPSGRTEQRFSMFTEYGEEEPPEKQGKLTPQALKKMLETSRQTSMMRSQQKLETIKENKAALAEDADEIMGNIFMNQAQQVQQKEMGIMERAVQKRTDSAYAKILADISGLEVDFNAAKATLVDCFAKGEELCKIPQQSVPDEWSGGVMVEKTELASDSVMVEKTELASDSVMVEAVSKDNSE
jgi:hypothetical protein